MTVLPLDLDSFSRGQMDLDGLGIGGGHVIQYRRKSSLAVRHPSLVVRRWSFAGWSFVDTNLLLRGPANKNLAQC